jgi:hypothetical protein
MREKNSCASISAQELYKMYSQQVVAIGGTAKCKSDSPQSLESGISIGPILRRVYGCLCLIVFRYPFLLFFLNMNSMFPFVCSITVASTFTRVEGMTGLPRSVYSRDPSSCISSRARTSPTLTSRRRGTVSMSRGVRMYFRPVNEAMMYWEGWERMISRADVVESGRPCVWNTRLVIVHNGVTLKMLEQEMI